MQTAHANKDRFSRIAADPSLSPPASAKNLARSWGAAAKLGQKALDYARSAGKERIERTPD